MAEESTRMYEHVVVSRPEPGVVEVMLNRCGYPQCQQCCGADGSDTAATRGAARRGVVLRGLALLRTLLPPCC